MRTAVILAGGRGTRLSEVAGDVPKPLVPVAGIPVIERQLQLLARYEFREVVVTTGYRADLVAARLGDGSRFGVKLRSIAEPHPLGTAGGVRELQGAVVEPFLVLYGDVMVHMDLDRLYAFHQETQAEATLVVHPNDHPADSDLVSVGPDRRIEAFHPAPRPPDAPDLRNLVSAALYVLQPSALAYIERGTPQDFVRDVFPRMLAAGRPLFAYSTTEYLKDMGTPRRLASVERDFASGAVEARHREHPRPAVFLDRDGVVNAEIGGVHQPDALRLLDGAAASIRRLNRAGWLVALVSNQPDVAKGFISSDDLERVHRRLERRLGDAGAWLDDSEYCVHHPEAGHPGERRALKIPCTCRKPAPGMLESIAARLPVDRKRAVLVGDNWRDFAAARAFRIDSIGVRSSPRLDEPAPAEYRVAGRPQAVVEDLAEAVALLLDPQPEIEELASAVAARRSSGAGPRALLLGGLAGAGKTATAFRLVRDLRARGIEALWVRLDDWILPAEARVEPSHLRERFRWPRLVEDVGRLLAGEAVMAPGYDPLDQRAPVPVPYDPAGAQILILEGVPALLLDVGGPAPLRAHVNPPDEPTRRRRLLRLYARRGLDAEGMGALLEARREEHEAVADATALADVTLQPLPFDRRSSFVAEGGS